MKDQKLNFLEILQATDYQPENFSKPQNIIELLDWDGDVDDFKIRRKILSIENQDEYLHANFCFYIDENSRTQTFFLKIERNDDFIDISIKGNSSEEYRFALALRDDNFRFLYWNQKQFVYRVHVSRLPQDCGRFDILLFWDNGENQINAIEIPKASLVRYAAGVNNDMDDNFVNITEISEETLIRFERRGNGYRIVLNNDPPIRAEIIFFKEDKQLYKGTISEQIPDELIPVKCLEGWTRIQLRLLGSC